MPEVLGDRGKENDGPDATSQGWFTFQFVGVDCLGPLMVKHGRRIEYRYDCLLICCRMRAVLLEVSYSSSADSIIMAPLRLMSRRGTPPEIFSDKKTNFVGAQRELENIVENWPNWGTSDRLMQKGVQWNFNPPSAFTKEERGRSWGVRQHIVVLNMWQTVSNRRRADYLSCRL